MKIVEFRKGRTVDAKGVEWVEIADGVRIDATSALVQGQPIEVVFRHDGAEWKVPLEKKGSGPRAFVMTSFDFMKYTPGELLQLGKALVRLAEEKLQ